MNKVDLIGRLTRNPELRYTPNNRPVAQLALAVKRRYAKDTDEIKADYFSIEIWGAHAENCKKYLVKGSQIGVSGELRVRSYVNRDGVKKYVTYIIADGVDFLGTRKQGTTTPEQEEPIPNETIEQEESDELYGEDYLSQINDDDLPF